MRDRGERMRRPKALPLIAPAEVIGDLDRHTGAARTMPGLMSKRIQRQPRDRRDAAKEREENARERAARNRERGDQLLARWHEHAADQQVAAAQTAEHVRLSDVEVEGDQLAERNTHSRKQRRT